MDSTAQNLPGSFATPNEAMDTMVAHSHGTVRTRSRTPEAVMREGFRDESGVVKKVQVVERDALETQVRIRRRDKMITNLSAMVGKK